MRLSRLAIVLSLAIALAWPTTAGAWSRAGHMVIGAMAYAMLRDLDPTALEASLELLRSHPHYTALLAAPSDWRLDEEDQRVALFMRASRWADDTRSEPFDELSRSTWHYVNFHYQPPGLTPPGAPDRDGFLVRALDENLLRLTGGNSPEQRAIALAWLLHLVGDVHQPLHSVALFDADHLRGDRGGNEFFVRVSEGSRTVRLHALWDNLLIGTDRFRDVRNRATLLRARASGDSMRRAGHEASDFVAWSGESAELAVQYVYLGGRLRSGTQLQGALIPAEYLNNARPVAQQQAVLGARRLARLLAEAR